MEPLVAPARRYHPNMATPDWVVPAITGTAAVVAAVSAQAVAAIFTAKRERKRLEWDTQQSALTAEETRRAKFSDEKRILFAQFLADHEALVKAIQEYMKQEDNAKRIDLDEQWRVTQGATHLAFEQIILVAPDLYSPCLAVQARAYDTMLLIRGDIINPDFVAEVADTETDVSRMRHRSVFRLQDQIKLCRHSMSINLGVLSERSAWSGGVLITQPPPNGDQDKG
jgi:hypothetical protein